MRGPLLLVIRTGRVADSTETTLATVRQPRQTLGILPHRAVDLRKL
jgi:hypothetical protein